MPKAAISRLYAGRDPRTLPAYSFAEAALYLRIPKQTIRNWVLGHGKVEPVFNIDDPGGENLSFMNLIEAHILGGIRRHYGVQLPMVRTALQHLQDKYSIPRPLIDERFQTDGKCLFVEKYGNLINASRDGQIVLESLLNMQLERIDRDKIGLPIRLYPFTRASEPDEGRIEQPKLVVMNARVSFGRPTVGGIPTSVIWSRYRAGDSSSHLAEDYGLTPEQIDEAIRCEAA